MKRYTTVMDREEEVALRQGGYSNRQIVEQTGWSYGEVGKVWYAYQKHPECIHKAAPLGRPKVGSLGSFDPLVRFASLRLKLRQPRWGPDVVLGELTKQRWAHEVKQASASRIGVYFSQFGDRLVQVRAHKQLPQAGKLGAVDWMPPSCWQLDMVERLALPGYGLVNLLDVVAMVTGITIATQLFPAHRVYPKLGAS